MGVPDEYRGETVVAFVSLQPDSQATAEDIIAHCKEHLGELQGARRGDHRRRAAEDELGQDPPPDGRDEATQARQAQPDAH